MTTNVHEEVVRLITSAALHLDEADHLLRRVDITEEGAYIERLRRQIHRLTVEVAMIGALN
jgi:hypothetical protein